MIKIIHYTYLGENGTITSPIKLPDIYHIKQYKIIAGADCKLTKDGISFYQTKLIPLSEIDEWYEVPDDGQR